MEVTLLCDRKTTNVAKSQIGFINFVVYPYFDALTKVFPLMQYTCDQLKVNADIWAGSVDEYEKKMIETSNEGI